MWRGDLVWRAVLVAVAAACALFGAPEGLSGALVVLGLVASVERLVRLRGAGVLDVVLGCVGALVAVLTVVGFLLGLTPLGMGHREWAVAVSDVSVVALVVARLRPRPAPPAWTRATHLRVVRGLPWVAVAAALVVVGLSGSLGGSSSPTTARALTPGAAPSPTAPSPTTSATPAGSPSATPTSAASTPPGLQMSLGSVSGTRVEVVVASGVAAGPLEVRSTVAGTEISYPLFTVTAGQPVTTVLALPATGRYEITLNDPASEAPIRSLVLDR